MHISTMRSFVPDQAALQATKNGAAPARAYDSQRVQAVPGGDDRDSRGSRQPMPARSTARLGAFDNGINAMKNFSSQLAALDLSALDQGEADPSSGAGEAPNGGGDTAQSGLFQLLAQAAAKAD